MKSAGIVFFVAVVLLIPVVPQAQHAAAAGISGVVSPAGASVALTSENGRKATMTTAADGRYEFAALPEGNYILQVSAPGYAADSLQVRVPVEHSVIQNVRLLYISRIDGIDWSRGIIRARGRGLYPADAPNRPAAREMAKRAALSEAERNLLWIVEQIKIGPDQDLINLVARSYLVRIKGYLQGFRLVGERDTESGVEVELELPLTGQGGLTRYISD